MRVDTRAPLDLYGVVAFVMVAVGVVLVDPWGPFRVVFAIPLVLWAPGFAVTAALFPVRDRSADGWEQDTRQGEEDRVEGLDRLERFGLSLGLSIAVVSLLGLGLSYSPWGIGLGSLLVALCVVTLAACTVAVRRRRALAWSQRTRFRVVVPVEGWVPSSGSTRVWSVALFAAVLVTAGTFTFVMTTDREVEAFTEFYVLDLEENAADYPTRLAPGENASVVVAVSNLEHAPADYTVSVTSIRGELVREGETFVPVEEQVLGSWSVSLDHEEAQKRLFRFSLEEEGLHRVGFTLKMEGAGEEPYRSLHLWVRVVG